MEKEDLYNQHVHDELSVKQRSHSSGLALARLSSIVMTAARNSFVLRPPIPWSKASNQHVMVRWQKMMLLMGYPLTACWRKVHQRWRSSLTASDARDMGKLHCPKADLVFGEYDGEGSGFDDPAQNCLDLCKAAISKKFAKGEDMSTSNGFCTGKR
eukprot:12524947-Ditylum_brightwellii.AAC.1